ncbi:MAG: MATE family efflux transporter, partial [Vulcanimicrobiaceae bacterium]
MIVDHRDVGAAFRRLAVPLAVQFAGDQILGIVDTIVIGSFGATALAGVTASSAIFFALSAMVISLLSGGAILAAQRIGARDLDGFAATIRAATVGPFILGLFITLGTMLGGENIVRALVGNIASAHASGVYLALRSVSLLVMIFSATLIGGLGAAGNRRLGIHVLAIINLIHIPLVLTLALGLLTHHPFGIIGAGISSLVSEIVGMIYAIVYVARHPEYRIFSSLRISLRTAWECTRMGAPEAIFIGAILIPDAMLVKFIAPLGVMAVAGLRALNIASDLTFIVPSPLQSATQTVIGQRLGAKDPVGALVFFHKA